MLLTPFSQLVPRSLVLLIFLLLPLLLLLRLRSKLLHCSHPRAIAQVTNMVFLILSCSSSRAWIFLAFLFAFSCSTLTARLLCHARCIKRWLCYSSHGRCSCERRKCNESEKWNCDIFWWAFWRFEGVLWHDDLTVLVFLSSHLFLIFALSSSFFFVDLGILKHMIFWLFFSPFSGAEIKHDPAKHECSSISRPPAYGILMAWILLSISSLASSTLVRIFFSSFPLCLSRSFASSQTKSKQIESVKAKM